MNKLGLFALAARQASGVAGVRRRSWIMLGVGLLVLLGLSIWAALAAIGWMSGQAQAWTAALNAAAPRVAQGTLEQVEQVMPGAREKLGEIVPALKPGERPRRDVSGTDLAPVARYPGLTRSFWHREGKRVTVSYEGRADYGAVLDHYAKGFAALGFAQGVQSATPEAETHEYVREDRRYLVKISTTDGNVKVDMDTQLQ